MRSLWRRFMAWLAPEDEAVTYVHFGRDGDGFELDLTGAVPVVRPLSKENA